MNIVFSQTGKEQDTKDSRAYWLNLNEKGQRLYDELAPYALSWETELLVGLNKNEQEQLKEILSKLSLRLESMN